MAQSKSQNKDIRKFVEQLLEDKQVDYLDKDVREQLIDNLVERAENQIKAALLAKIPDNKLDEFEDLLKQDDATKVQTFIGKHVSNTSEVIAHALLRFRSAYLGTSK